MQRTNETVWLALVVVLHLGGLGCVSVRSGAVDGMRLERIEERVTTLEVQLASVVETLMAHVQGPAPEAAAQAEAERLQVGREPESLENPRSRLAAAAYEPSRWRGADGE